MPRKEYYNKTKIVIINGQEFEKKYYKADKRKYRTNQATRLTNEQVRKMFDAIDNVYVERDDEHDREEKRFLISILWITGARPQEIFQLRKQDFTQPNDSILNIHIKTLKLEEDGQFMPQERDLPIGITDCTNENYIYVKTVFNWVANLPYEDSKILERTTRWGQYVIERLSKETLGIPFAPYHFRHSTFSWMDANKYSFAEIKAWKGAKSDASVSIYLHASPTLNMATFNRSRGATIGTIQSSQIVADKQSTSESTQPASQPEETVPNQVVQDPEVIQKQEIVKEEQPASAPEPAQTSADINNQIVNNDNQVVNKEDVKDEAEPKTSESFGEMFNKLTKPNVNKTSDSEDVKC